MYGYGYKYTSGLVLGAGGGAPFVNAYSLDFDGVDDYVGTNSKIIGSDITLSGWVNFNGGSYTSSVAQFPMSITPSNTSAPNETIGRFYKVGVNMRISIQCFDQNGANYSTYTVPGLNFEGAGWNHVCWTYNVTTRHIYVYINGVAQNWLNFSGSVTTPYLTAISGRLYESDLTIGRQKPTTPTGTYLGLVDEVSTYGRILTQEEITSISTTPTDLSDLNPIAWYRMGDNGSFKSPQWLIPNNENKDKFSNYSFELDGLDDYIDCGDSDDFSFGDGATDSPFTISAWIKMDSTSGFRIFNKSLGATSEYQFGTGGGGTLQLYLFDNTSNFIYRARVYTTVLSTGQWYHVATTYSGVGGTNAQDGIKIYVDGVRVDDSSVSGGTYVAMGNKTTPLYIGKLDSSYANGSVDEVSVFDSELSASEVMDIYNGGTSSGAIAHYKMGEEATFSGGVWTVPDAVGSNDGTSNAMTIEDRIGEASSSENNALSYNMDLVDRVTDTP